MIEVELCDELGEVDDDLFNDLCWRMNCAAPNRLVST